MRLGFTTILALHWAIVFATLAFGTLVGVGGGLGAQLAMMGVQPIADAPQGPMALLSVLAAGGFVFTALLFAWACASGVFPKVGGENDQVDLSRMAYGAAISSMSIVVVSGLVGAAQNIFPAIAVQVAALSACYLATYVERLNAALTAVPEADDVRAAARLMALGAAHGAMLSRIAGRDARSPGGAG